MRVDCDLGVPERSTAGPQQRRDRDPSIPRSSRWAVDLLDGWAQVEFLFFFFSFSSPFFSLSLTPPFIPGPSFVRDHHHDFILTSSCNSSLCHVFAAFVVVICVGRFTHTQFGYLYDPR
ncbi:hypothetical protein BO99DRAFT_21876 [Aspergillus violaceofuscus CBS 115571]|uniref:Uncharacterized protein n=1 Tax=Aspergillus violaceofuscus (strain CBS 115571) TaxID=1450538 RepID=A0A2V5GZ03_ASPV1|nr:hypothetical protein BO99DRAFT_21876 [Aspergillus violaceofuscus CBS 115571]